MECWSGVLAWNVGVEYWHSVLEPWCEVESWHGVLKWNLGVE